MTETQFVILETKVDAQDFWSGILGSGWENGYAWVKIEYVGEADWDIVGRFVISYLDHNDEEGEEKVLTKELGIEDLVEAYGKCSSQNLHHCNSKYDWNDPDFCVSDGVLQMAVYGEIIYG
jgi:hypothetical protein